MYLSKTEDRECHMSKREEDGSTIQRTIISVCKCRTDAFELYATRDSALSLSLFLKVLIAYLYLAFKALKATLWLQRIAF